MWQKSSKVQKEEALRLPRVPYLLVDVLQQWFPSVLYLFTVLLQGVGVPEVRLGVDVVEAGLQHHQLPVQQLHVLQERKALLTLPPSDLLTLNPSPSRD